jgi:hypothetical protein
MKVVNCYACMDDGFVRFIDGAYSHCKCQNERIEAEPHASDNKHTLAWCTNAERAVDAAWEKNR